MLARVWGLFALAHARNFRNGIYLYFIILDQGVTYVPQEAVVL